MIHLELAALSLVLACAATSTPPELPALPTNSLVLAYLATFTVLGARAMATARRRSVAIRQRIACLAVQHGGAEAASATRHAALPDPDGPKCSPNGPEGRERHTSPNQGCSQTQPLVLQVP